MTIKKISIITPTYNQGQYIEQTIDSVLSQNYPNLEYIIIDGGSTDNTVEIIKKYEKHLKYWVSEPDKGQSHAINKGLKYATGDIINWINSDDYYATDVFNIVAENFSNNDINILCGKSRIFGEGINDKISKGTYVNKSNLAKTIGQSIYDQPSTFVKNEIFMKLCPINNKLRYLMDRELWIKYLLIYDINKVHQTDDVFVNFRMHNDSKSVKENSEFNIERDSIFYALAQKTGNKKAKKIIKQNNKEVFKYSLPISNLKKGLINDVLTYYLMLLGEEKYNENKTKEAYAIFKSIDNTVLIEKEKKCFRELKLKNQIKLYLPFIWNLKKK